MKPRSILTSIVCASLMVALPGAQASAAPLAKTTSARSDSNVTLIGRGRGRGWGRGPGPGVIIGGIVAGTLIAAAIREGRAHEDDIERCYEDFPSFDGRTGTYINRYGEERVCPYLR